MVGKNEGNEGREEKKVVSLVIKRVWEMWKSERSRGESLSLRMQVKTRWRCKVEDRRE